jgi:hypothetical protein
MIMKSENGSRRVADQNSDVTHDASCLELITVWIVQSSLSRKKTKLGTLYSDRSREKPEPWFMVSEASLQNITFDFHIDPSLHTAVFLCGILDRERGK